ncbi:hypothetical protein E7T06_18950 [Deinococcus sp. Arct2-2]|uniref:hypothetical protein n=1 Tax=Deinococcus sp. Arct2-2 TaxID=2568653 RepID=UPI0010A4E9D0|nr:hypothetical protein [Deinococcus sp. Arct2-2]THF67871.1 hypothetical protein E7T06_18950 [Deinococcus sp. Arct2-2]
MKVLTHASEWVLVETEGEVIRLVRCLDRYVAYPNRQGVHGGETVQVWEDEQGKVIRLSRAPTPEALWAAQAWV